MRCNKEYDRSTALEILVSLFITKRFYASGDYNYLKLTENIRIILFLISLESTNTENSITDLSWGTLEYLYKSSQENFRWKAPKDLFSEGVDGTPLVFNRNTEDLFYHRLGKISSDEYHSDSRFGSYNTEYPRLYIKPGLDLGQSSFTNPGTDWFENTSGELMGAFLHIQVQDPKNPFNINLSLPPLEPAPSHSQYPFPCIPINNPTKAAKPTNSNNFDWSHVTEQLISNNDMFIYDSNTLKKQNLWEKNEKTIRVQGILSQLSKDYEKYLRKNLDSSYTQAEHPLDNSEFIRNIKNLILGIPNKLYSIDNRIPKQRFRLESYAHEVLQNFMKDILISSQSYKYLLSLSISMQGKKELISPAFASGLTQILSFFENYIIDIPNTITVIQFYIQTQSLRSQIQSIKAICEDIPTGLKLMDYLYDVISRNEGDFENYHLLQMVFKSVLKPLLEILSGFVFACEVHDVYGEFVVQFNKDLPSSVNYTLESYVNAFQYFPSLVFDSVKDELLNIGRNMRILKFLEEDLSFYFQILSTATLSSLEITDIQVPRFKLSYKPFKINLISDVFLNFQAEQTKCLLILEKKEIELQKTKSELLVRKKKSHVQEIKLVSTSQKKFEQEKLLEKKQQQWNFYKILESQLNENKEFKRISQQKIQESERKLQEKIEQEQRDLVEKGKKYLMEKHQEMLDGLYFKKALEEWKKKRLELNSKRLEFFKRGEDESSPVLLDKMDIEVIPDTVDTEMKKEDEVDANVYYPVRVRQPPGGISTIGELFVYDFPEPSEKTKAPQPTYEYKNELEKLQICSDLLWEEILNKVFRKITPKKKWELQPKKEVFNIFEDLFPNFSEKMNETKNFSVPFTKIIQRLILEPIKAQSDILNKACVHLFLRKLNLIDHLKALKRYSLLEAGDTIDLFLNTIFSASFTGNMTAAWEGSLKMTSSKDDEYGEIFRIALKKNNLYKMQFKTVEDLDFLLIQYKLKGPLELVISQDVIDQYCKAFCCLLRVKYVTSVLSNIKIFRVPASHVYHRKIHLLRQKMQHFLDIYQGYIASELHGSSWKYLTKNINKATSIEDIIDIHKKYLEMIMTRCFLTGKGKVVMEQLKIIFQLVMRFQNIVLELDEYAIREVDLIEQDFNSIHRFLFKMTQTMANKGNYPELFLRLDFNNFMTQKIEKEQIKS